MSQRPPLAARAPGRPGARRRAPRIPATRTTSSSSGQAFRDLYGFDFDTFQQRALSALDDGRSVLVAAPTGSGKTVVGEYAAWLALTGHGRAFYTTPIKALSNQKYADFVALHGGESVGLLTGDNAINGDAPIVVMTTEVLRNMLYEDAPGLDSLAYVVLDEVHYLQDPYRGAVWEEVLIHLPVDVTVVSLSATVSNAEEFAEWLQTLRGPTEVIIEERRPVEIRHWYFVSDELLPMFVVRPDGTAAPNPRGSEFERRRRRGEGRPRRGGRRPQEKRGRIPWRADVIDRLDSEGMLPAIYFIFSRRGCDDAVRQCLRENVRLTTAEERGAILEAAEERVQELSPEELAVLRYDEWLAGLTAGVAAHHAGMIPPFKETVEELFARGLLKVAFATETLALGINMPARTVVIESLVKFTGERHELMTPGEYTQLSGRAGRRGIDELGHCCVLYQRDTPFDGITRLATTRTFPLRSSFAPSYNMAVNLVRNYSRADAEHLLNSSFAQFQADRDVVQLERTKERSEAYLASYRDKMACDRGDFGEYLELHRRWQALTGAASKQKSPLANVLLRLNPGEVVDIQAGRRRGRYVVLEVNVARSERQPKLLAMSKERTMVRFSPAELREAPISLGRLPLPKGFNARDAHARRRLARALAAFEPQTRERAEPFVFEPSEGVDEAAPLGEALRNHPCSGCPDLGRHLHFAERAARLEREAASLSRRINRRTATLARRFERVLHVLERLGYVERWALTAKGELLTRVYNEADLLVVEAVERGLLDDLDPAEIAGLCSTLVYETRGPEAPSIEPWPTRRGARAFDRLIALWHGIREEEDRRNLDLTREPDAGFAARAHRWAEGADLDEVIAEEDAPGDFVRSVKQLVDLLRQIAEIAPSEELADRVGLAVDGLQRGLVAYSSLEI